MSDLITAIIPTYKRPFKLLERALRSVLAQTYRNIEVVVVDDSPSTYQGRAEIAANIHLDDRVTYIQHDAQKGACAARNTGLAHANGKYIAFLDDDDEWLPEKIELQYRRIEETGAAMIYSGAYRIILREGKEYSRRRTYCTKTGFLYEDLLRKNFIGSTSFVLLDKAVLEELGGFNVEMASAQDVELWIRIAKGHTIDCVDEPLTNYYIHDGDRISSDADKKIKGLETLMSLHADFFNLHPDIKSLNLLKIVAYYRTRDGRSAALRKWREAAALHPVSLTSLKTLVKIFVHE